MRRFALAHLQVTAPGTSELGTSDSDDLRKEFSGFNKTRRGDHKGERGMKIFAAAILAVLAAAFPAGAQEHAPRVETCRADLTTWNGEMSGYWGAENVKHDSSLPNKSAVSSLSAAELLNRAAEIGQCLNVDSSNRSAYEGLEALYLQIVGDRAQWFIKRHGLGRSFDKEDKAGMR